MSHNPSFQSLVLSSHEFKSNISLSDDNKGPLVLDLSDRVNVLFWSEVSSTDKSVKAARPRTLSHSSALTNYLPSFSLEIWKELPPTRLHFSVPDVASRLAHILHALLNTATRWPSGSLSEQSLKKTAYLRNPQSAVTVIFSDFHLNDHIFLIEAFYFKILLNYRKMAVCIKWQ